jgi:gas vesicle protein GvpG
MGLLTGLLSLPMKPVRGVMWTAEQLKRHAEREYYDPAMIQHQLAEIDEAHAAGELTDQQRDELQAEWLDRLLEAQHGRAAEE